jgi:hypothetical protein
LRSRTVLVIVTRQPGPVPGACIPSPILPSTRCLPSTHSAADRSALFAGFIGTTHLSDFSCPCIAGYGSSPSRRGPAAVPRHRSDVRSPRFRRDPFVRDGVFDHGRASAPRIAAPHMLPSASSTVSASAVLCLSRLNSPPHTIVVYASPRTSPPSTQHSLPGGRYPLPGPDLHRLDHASFLAHRRTTKRLLLPRVASPALPPIPNAPARQRWLRLRYLCNFRSTHPQGE